MRLFEQLGRHARHRPDAIALSRVDADGRCVQSLSFGEYLRAVRRVAHGFARMTSDKDVVLIQLPNTLTYPVAFLGVLAAGRTVFPLHPALTPHEVGEAAKNTGAKWIICSQSEFPGMTAITPEQIDRWVSDPDQPLADEMPPDPGVASMLLQSSGTTGLPKIVERSADSIDAVASNVVEAVGLTLEDQVLAAIPLCHSYGIENAVVGPLWAGACVRVCEGFAPETIAALWTQSERSVFPAVPIMIDMLARQSGLAMPGPNLRAVYTAGATLPAVVAQAFYECYGHHVGQLYGATEIGSVTYGGVDGGPLDECCVGRPMKGVSIRIHDLEQPDRHPPLAPGQEGQVAISAPSMLDRYIGSDRVPVIHGHYLTGDLGQLDEAGALSITGRVKTLIEVGGIKVNPAQVEAVIAAHPGVAECAVVPVKVTHTLSRVTAFVVPSDAGNPPSTAELRAHAKERIAAFKVPRAFNMVGSLPRTSLGKVQRQKLMETP